MEEIRHQTINNLLKTYEGKKIRLLTKNNLSYQTFDLRVLDNFISFHDKFGDSVLLSISEISKIQEVSG